MRTDFGQNLGPWSKRRCRNKALLAKCSGWSSSI